MHAMPRFLEQMMFVLRMHSCLVYTTKPTKGNGLENCAPHDPVISGQLHAPINKQP
jgi:hypothetical protein